MQTNFFSSPNNPGDQTLTQRLYPDSAPEHDPYAHTTTDTFEDLKKMIATHSGIPPSGSLEVDNTTDQVLETCIRAFQAEQAEKMKRYLVRKKQTREENCLYYLSGWAKPAHTCDEAYYLTEKSRRATGGIFLRWNGKGIAINPGANFLKNFHAQGLHIRDIDYIIVTGEDPDCCCDIKEIYELNYQLNKVSNELQILHYYIYQKAYQALSSILKPHFKQERNSLHSLELFVDSPEVEKIEIGEGILLHYFLAGQRDAFPTSHMQEDRQPTGLGIRLDFIESRERVQIGYMAHCGWTPLMAHHLGSCDLLITGFGNTTIQDYQKLAYNNDNLGYFGTCTLVEEMAPRLLLCGEFGGREGDIRLEVAQKLRKETSHTKSVILPADSGLCVHLKSLQVRCSVSGAWIDARHVNVVKTAHAFGPLAYLAASFVI